MADTSYEYQVTTAYDAADTDEIDIHVDDIVVVTSEELDKQQVFDKSDIRKWVHGHNKTTDETGFVPGTLLRFLPIGRPDEEDYSYFEPQAAEEHMSSIRYHVFEDKYSKEPILCSLCIDYIWGTAIRQCRCCGSTFHPGCAEEAGKCRSQTDEPNVVALNPERIPLRDWNMEDLLKWLAAVNMSRYIDNLKKAPTLLQELPFLSEAQLEERIEGFKISDEFHKEALTVLLKRLGDPNPEDLYLSHEPNIDIFIGDALDHNLIEYNFPDMEKCDRCTQGLFGIFRQGWLCKGCGLVVHRQCAVGKLPECGKKNFWERSRHPLTIQTFVEDPYYGSSLENVQHSKKVNGVPALLSYSAQELERRQADPYRTRSHIFIYRAPAGVHQKDITELKRRFDLEDESSKIDLTTCHDVVIPGVIKKYLKELSNPVVCSDLYQLFINVCEMKDENDQLVELHKLIGQLPDIHKKTLEFLFKHFHNLCPGPDDVNRVFSNILFRPEWQDIMLIADNTQKHKQLITLLLKLYSPDQETIDSGGKELKQCLWFWDNISREEEEEKMNGQPDGTFLVRRGRALSSEGEYYTISLRKGGSKVLIKIVEMPGENDKARVGFTKEQLKFHSVPELIDYYREQTLKNYNERLDVRLSNPIERKLQTSGMEAQEIEKVKIRLCDKKDELNALDERLSDRNIDLEKRSSELHQFNQAYDSFVHLITEFENQKTLSDKTMRSPSTKNFYKSLEQNSKKIETRLNKFKENKRKLEKKVEETENLKQKAITEIHSLKHSARKLEKEVDDLVRKLKVNGVTEADIEKLFRNADNSRDNDYEMMHNTSTPTHYTEDPYEPAPISPPPRPQRRQPPPPPQSQKFILKRWDIDRRKAENLVEKRPSGSYLLRISTRDVSIPYVLTVMTDKPHHCQISQNPQTKALGFYGSEMNYSSIEELVEVYQHQSLKKHNTNLDITLVEQVTEEDAAEEPYSYR